MLDESTWQAGADEWLPTPGDRERVESLMIPEYEYGEFAGWIAPPKSGINDQPVEFDYVHLADEGLI